MESKSQKWPRFIILAWPFAVMTIALDIEAIAAMHCDACAWIYKNGYLRAAGDITLLAFPGSAYLHMVIAGIQETAAIVLANAMAAILLAILFVVSRRIGGGRLSLSIATAVGYVAISAAAGPYW